MSASQDRKDQLLLYLVNPEVYFWLVVLLFGTVATGWFLIGVGVVFALIPLGGILVYGLLRKQQAQNDISGEGAKEVTH